MHSPKGAAARFQCQDSLIPDGSDNKVRRDWGRLIGSGSVLLVVPGFRGFFARIALLGRLSRERWEKEIN